MAKRSKPRPGNEIPGIRCLQANSEKSRPNVPVTLPSAGGSYVFIDSRLVRDGIALPEREAA